MENLISADNLCKLLKLGLPDNGKKPSFVPVHNRDPKNPFGGLESQSLFGSYVSRNNREIEVLVEIRDYDSDSGVTFGDTFTPAGLFIRLEEEEEIRIEREFVANLPR